MPELVTSILILADNLAISPAHINRALYRKHHGSARAIDKHWTEAKAAAVAAWTKKQTTTVAFDGEREPVDAIPQVHSVRGVSTLVRTPEGGLQWIKTRRNYEEREQVVERLLRDLPGTIQAAKPVELIYRKAQSDLVAVYPMGDPHIGMLSWAPESGESWDLKIAEDINNQAIRSLVSRGPQTEKALLINLGDFFHSDTPHATTTKGTRLDVDGRWSRTLEIGMRTIVYTIEQLLLVHSAVIVDCQIGNHDEHSSIMLAIGLRERYRNEPRCTVEVNPNPYHYHRFGNVLIGTCHGDGAKIQDLPGIMASDCKHWSSCEFRHWLTGHVHHSQVKEFPGCTVESFRTLAPRDAWHHKSGYRARRDMQKIVFHTEHGELSREFFNPRMVPR